MSGKHRKIGSRTKKIATVGVATATVTAMTVGAAPPPPKPKPEPVVKNVDLMAAINPWPSPHQIPDLTFGVGTAVYDTSQAVADLVIRAIVENINLAALAQAAGLDLDSLVEGLLGGDLNDLLGGVLDGVLGEIPLDTSDLANALLLGLPVGDLVEGALAEALGLLGADSVGGLLGLLGLDLSDPLNLANLNVPGVNIITAGPAFTLLKLLGVDLGWVPSLPNSVANEINNTGYLPIGLNGLLDTVSDLLAGVPLGAALKLILDPVIGTLPNLDVLDLRVPVTIGIGLGAFAAATGYEKVRDDLENQPGGENYQGDSPLLGSLTVLPMLLALNPARPNGGALARFYPLFGLAGINTVNPRTEASSSCGNTLCFPVLGTGLTLGGANLLPVLIDVGLGYFPANDLAAWPNPFSLANNAMALALPTYLLRGLDVSTVDEQVTTQVGDILADVLAGNPLAINVYLTLMPNTLPLLEPLYLVSDVISLATLGTASVNPVSMLANALAPALTSLVNLGYTDVVRNPDGTYTRTLTEAGDPTPFFSFPSGINPIQVVPDVLNLLVKGIQKEFLSGNPTPGTPNAITGLLDLLTGTLPLGGLGGLLDGVLGDVLGGLNLNQLVADQISPVAANALPSADSKMVTLSTDPEGDVSTGKHAAADAPVPEDTGAEPKHAAEEVEPEEEPAEETEPTTEPTEDVEEDVDEETSSGSTTPKPTTSPKPAAPRNPVGDVVGGAANVVANGVAGVLKGLAPKKPASTTKTTTTTKTDTADKDSTDNDSSSKDAA